MLLDICKHNKLMGNCKHCSLDLAYLFVCWLEKSHNVRKGHLDELVIVADE